MASMSGRTIRIPWSKPVFWGNEKKYVNEAVESTWISGGSFIERFEAEFTALHGMSYGITVSNGTTALQLALMSLGIGPGDEVIVPGFTFVAPVNMVIGLGATPVYADIDVRTWSIDPVSVERCITDRTKVILAVHIYGNVCDMGPLKKLATDRGLFLIEDNAESMFSRYKGQYSGTFGDAGCFSFQATKTIAMGEGGFVLFSRKDTYDCARTIRDHGMRPGKRYWHDVVGYNFRLTNLQAALGYAQLERTQDIISNRRRVFDLYRKNLTGMPGVTLQHFPSDVDPVVWAVAAKIDPEFFKVDRDGFLQAMLEAGVEMRPGFYPMGHMPLYQTTALPVSTEVGLNVLIFPSFPSLTEEKIDYIVRQFRKILK